LVGVVGLKSGEKWRQIAASHFSGLLPILSPNKKDFDLERLSCAETLGKLC
jgi:hypothetical protein